MKLVLGTILFMLSLGVSAGQCNYIVKDQAASLLKILEDHQSKSELMIIDQYCESCFDPYPKPILVDSYQIRLNKKANIFELSINTKKYDLAYLYVDGENLGTKIGCKTYAVSKVLD